MIGTPGDAESVKIQFPMTKVAMEVDSFDGGASCSSIADRP